MNSKIAVVTGAPSFLGSALAECLLKKGYTVIAVVRKNSPNLYRLNNAKGVVFVELDLGHIRELPSHVDKADVFFHIAHYTKNRQSAAVLPQWAGVGNCLGELST